MSDEQIRSFEKTQVMQYVGNYASAPVVAHFSVAPWKGGRVLCLRVEQFASMPVVCIKQGVRPRDKTDPASKDTVVLAPGDIYVRTDKATSQRVPDHAAMLELVSAALRKQSDQLLSDVSRIMRGASVNQAQPEDTWASEQAITDSRLDADDTTVDGLGQVRYTVHPVTRGAIDASPKSITEALMAASVELRGWDFPHIDRRGPGAVNLQDPTTRTLYVEQFTSFQHIYECWRAFGNGFFSLRRVLTEDLFERTGRRFVVQLPATKGFNWVQAIGETGEFLLFVSRFYDALGYDGEVTITIDYTGLGGRTLFTYSPNRMLYQTHATSSPAYGYRSTLSLADLRTDRAGAAVPMLRELFSLFGWDADENARLRPDIADLYSRKL